MRRMKLLGAWGLGLTLAVGKAGAADQPSWDQAGSRNQVSAESGLPSSFDLDSGRNVRWTAELGSESHSTPVVAGGRVFVGTNDDHPRDSRHEGDRGVLMCLRESDGTLLWQLVVRARGSWSCCSG